MRVSVSTILQCSAAAAWREVVKPSTLLRVATPLAVIRALPDAPFPEAWSQGTYRCRSRLFGLVPTGTRRIVLERVDPARREIQSRESDPLVRRWDHLIRLAPADPADPDGPTLYTDTIDIEAGALTPLVWLFAALFYRHRQRRWRSLARTLR
jgi:hypothetical protein